MDEHLSIVTKRLYSNVIVSSGTTNAQNRWTCYHSKKRIKSCRGGFKRKPRRACYPYSLTSERKSEFTLQYTYLSKKLQAQEPSSHIKYLFIGGITVRIALEKGLVSLTYASIYFKIRLFVLMGLVACVHRRHLWRSVLLLLFVFCSFWKYKLPSI